MTRYQGVVLLIIIFCLFIVYWNGRDEQGMRSSEEASRERELALKYEYREPS
jgi:hypothetical protein